MKKRKKLPKNVKKWSKQTPNKRQKRKLFALHHRNHAGLRHVWVIFLTQQASKTKITQFNTRFYAILTAFASKNRGFTAPQSVINAKRELQEKDYYVIEFLNNHDIT
jgi:hypothetical protein